MENLVKLKNQLVKGKNQLNRNMVQTEKMVKQKNLVKWKNW